MKKNKVTPTPAELEILNVLWEHQPMSVKSVNDILSGKKEVGYTTTLKIMQNMYAKGLLTRKLVGKGHQYKTAYKKEETQGNLLERFIDSTFAGSSSKLVMQLLGNKKTSQKELDEIKQIIQQIENEENK